MIGKKIQNYEIRSHLGEGGMGTVYRAADSILDREVALKMLHAPLLQQPLFLERFKKEARLLAQLLHPNIAVIYNLIEQEGNQFMVMEFVEGKNLEALLRQYRILSFKVVVPVMIQALEGLNHAHKKNIYHRDIKPSNLILTPDGTVKLMDFGIAMMAGEQRLTQVNRVVGTVEYLAPELIQGKEPSVATDVYAMGVTMYELLTGKLPFEGNTDFNLMQDILKKKPLAVDKLNGAIPKALSSIVMKALEKKPSDRFANAREFQKALTDAFGGLRGAELTDTYIRESAAVPLTATTPVAKKAPKPTAIITPGAGTVTSAHSLAGGWRQKLMAKENRVVVACAAAVLLAILIAVVFTSGGTDDAPVTALNKADKAAADSGVNRRVVSEDPAPQQSVPSGGGNAVIIPGPVEEKKEEEKKEAGKDTKKANKGTEKKETAKEKETEKKKEEPVVNPVPPPVPEKKEEVKPVEKREPKSVRLTSTVEVSLYLRDPLSASVQAGQSLTFVVTAPVRYGGDIIVEKGALARGSILSVGKKKIAIVLSGVTAASGQVLPLVQEELSGRIEDMINNRNYSATLKKGSTINF